MRAMEYAGYTVVDDRDAAITYTRPYTPDPVRITSGNREKHTYQDSNHGGAFAYTERRRSSEHTLQPYHKHESGR